MERYNRIIAAVEHLILEAGSLETITLDAVAKQASVPRASLCFFLLRLNRYSMSFISVVCGNERAKAKRRNGKHLRRKSRAAR